MKHFRYSIDYRTYPSYLLAKKGYAVDDIADIREVSEGTIVNHLIPYVYDGCFSSIDKFVSEETYERVSNYLKSHPCCNELKPIYESLNEEVSYNDISICYYYWNHTKRGVIDNDKVNENLRNARNDSRYEKSMKNSLNCNLMVSFLALLVNEKNTPTHRLRMIRIRKILGML